MKYFIAERIQQPLSQDAAMEWLPKHGAYMQYGIDSGNILTAGPKAVADGGYIVLRSENLQQAELFLSGDPMVKAGLQEYKLSEFVPLSFRTEIEKWCKE